MRFYRSIKMTIGFALAIYFAKWLHLEFPVSAGIIAMLNMLDTKRASAKVAWRRVYAAGIGMFVALFVFKNLGYHLWVMVVFMGLFIPIAFQLKAREGIAVNAVLTSHFMIYQEITLSHIGNELLLVLTGALVSFVMNIHMPDKSLKLIEMQNQLEELMKGFVLNLGMNIRNLCLVDHDAYDLTGMETLVKTAQTISYEYMNNYYLKNNHYFIEYFQMRLQQLRRLRYMEERLGEVIINFDEALIIGAFTERLADEFNKDNDGKKLLEDLQFLKDSFKTYDLPKTHYELEQKSFLIQYISDLEEFIRIKSRYMKLNI